MLSATGFQFRHAIAWLLGSALATSALAAAAQPADTQLPPVAQPAPSPEAETSTNPDATVDDPLAVTTERRGGFVLGVIVGPSFGWASGNPSDKGKRDDPALEQDTGLALGYRVTPFLGGALTDWFTFGLGMSFGSFGNGDYSSGVGTFVFHLEAFPLYTEGGVYRDLGLSADFGAGASSIRTKSPDEKVADSLVASTVGVGAFWEPLRFWHLAAGPHVGYQRNWSRWFTRDDVTVGLRVMFYGDQPM